MSMINIDKGHDESLTANGDAQVVEKPAATSDPQERERRFEGDEHGTPRGKHFNAASGVMRLMQDSTMIVPKDAEKGDMSDITKDIPISEKEKEDVVIYTPTSGYHHGDGTPIALTTSQICTYVGLCLALDMLKHKDEQRFLDYQHSLDRCFRDDNHKFICDYNSITMNLSDFAVLVWGKKRGRQTFQKAQTHKDLLFFNSLYGKFLTNEVKSSLFKEICNDSLINYMFWEEEKEWRGKTRIYITKIEIKFHDVFIYQGAGFTQFPYNFADLIEEYGKGSILFTYLFLDIIHTRGLVMGTIKKEANLIDEGKGSKKDKNIAKWASRKETRIYKRTQQYLLKELLGGDESRYYDKIKDKKTDEPKSRFRSSDWRKDLREAIEAFAKMGLILDISTYGDGHGTYLDGDGGLGCDLRINEKW